MRVKQLWCIVPVPSKLKLMWDRITFSRMTTLYFTFSVVHCFIQVLLQAHAFIINAEAANTLFEITEQGNAANQGFPVLGDDLRMCDNVPRNMSASSCRVVWDGTPGKKNAWTTASVSSATSPTPLFSSLAAISSSPAPSFLQSPVTTISDPPRRTVTIFTSATPTSVQSATGVPNRSDFAIHSVDVVRQGDYDYHDDDNFGKRGDLDDVHVQAVDFGGTTKITVNGPGFQKTAVLEMGCIWVLNYPVEILLNTKREDIVFVTFQFWVLGMSIVAIFNESIPHIIASLLTHMLATAWAGFQISHTANFRTNFIRLTMEGACMTSPSEGSRPINLLPLYWAGRRGAELPSLVLNIVALFISAFLTWKLVKLFGWQTFKRVGASRRIHRIYKTVLVLSITIQLGLFFMVVSVALWIDQLYNGSIGRFAVLSSVYKVVFVITLVLMLPWLMMGWFSIRRELKIPMMIFLVLCIGYLTGYGFMFLSETFRWTFVQWRFFSLMAIASVMLTVLSFVLGVVCRVNFGKGLRNYLNSEEPLPGDDFEPAFPSKDMEKFGIPNNENNPAFTTTLDASPSEMAYASYMGTGCHKISKIESQARVTAPSAAHMRLPSDSSVALSRHDTRVSNGSLHSSDASTLSRAGSQSSNYYPNRTTNTKRWVIE